jgi:D-sedoheptulose 7-phosphate isomerase
MADLAAQFDDHLQVIEQTRGLASQMESMGHHIAESISGGGTVYWMGNGGSAAEAQHLSTELIGHYMRERRGLPSVALTTDGVAMTGISNDFGYSQVFARQIEGLCGSGDVVVGLSTSGNSENVINGLVAAQQLGAFTIGMGGEDGGSMVAACDLSILVPSSDTQRVQEAHLLIGHIVCGLVEDALSAGADGE